LLNRIGRRSRHPLSGRPSDGKPSQLAGFA
jgi:hypothetical protein